MLEQIFEHVIILLLLLFFFLSFRTGNPPISNKTAVPPCVDEPSKKVFEQAITGALCKFITIFIAIVIIFTFYLFYINIL